EHGAPASFSDLCTGDRAGATGSVSGSTLSATHVVVVPPRPTRVSGPVASVDGSSAPGACGSGDGGSFTVTAGASADTVEVGPGTTFLERRVASPTFADLCVGDHAHVTGLTGSGAALDAERVGIVLPKPAKVSGPVESVDGSSTSGTCGSGDSGTFTVQSGSGTETVDVSPDTAFREHGVAAPSFDELCVGDHASVSGSVTSGDSVVHAFDVVVSLP
ncbi:MAG TPA: hypothetical protein VMB72_10600, partial [Acidimicrobiales bacterium]|nr:hypothetical protein [Acidimicrobiales bacterium]